MTWDGRFDESSDPLNDDVEVPHDQWADDSAETVPCPHCGDEIYEEAVQCPACGNYVTHRSSVWFGRSVWWVVLALLGIAALALVRSGLLSR